MPQSKCDGPVAASRVEVIGHVLVVRISGELTAATLLDVRTDVIAAKPAAVRAFVADYREAKIWLDGDGLDAVLLGEAPDSASLMPAALLVTKVHLDLFMAHALRMGALGHFRRAFVDQDRAISWAQSMAVHPTAAHRAVAARAPSP